MVCSHSIARTLGLSQWRETERQLLSCTEGLFHARWSLSVGLPELVVPPESLLRPRLGGPPSGRAGGCQVRG